MIILITTVTIILYIILISFTVHNLGTVMDTKIKIAFVVVNILIVFIATLVTFYISSSGIQYDNIEILNKIRNLIIAVFVPVNGIALLPYSASVVSKIGTKEITEDGFKKRLIIILIIFIIILIFECSYFKKIQLGILDIYNRM